MIERPERGLVTHTVQVVSITHRSLKAVSWTIAPTVGLVGRMYIPRSEDIHGLDGALRSTRGHALWMTSPNRKVAVIYKEQTIKEEFGG